MAKRIISASYREDIPAFRSEEFFSDLERGYTFIQTKAGRMRISLLPEDVYCFVFWTKNPSDHFIEHMKDIKVPFYIQWTVTPYGKDIEPNVPGLFELLMRFEEVSKAVGPERVIWRYDPICMSREMTVKWHCQTFESMCRMFEGLTHKCVISFMDGYGKISDVLRKGILRIPGGEEVLDIAKSFGKTAAKHGLTVQTCSEGQYDLTAFGIREAPCVDPVLIERLTGETLPARIKTPGSFRPCQCAVNTDIGSYHQCKHGCIYCYAK